MLDASGREANLKMYRFKDYTLLPCVRKTLGFLRGVQPESLLDVGSGRGVFRLPLLAEFPGVLVTAVDLLERRMKFVRQSFLQTVEQSNSHWLERPIIPNGLCRPRG